MLKQFEVKNIYIGEYTKPREPDSNTVVYWKLDWDAKDSSWNNRDWTVSWTLTYESIGSIDVAKFTGSQQVYRTWSEFALGNNHAFTFSVWVKFTNMSDASLACIQRENNSGIWDKELYVNYNGSFYGYFYTWTANYVQDTTAWEITTSSWYNIIYTFDWSTLKLYLNWTLKKSSTPALGSYTIVSPQLILSRPTYYGSNRYKWYMSNFILQNNAWDASYISNYFNTYKWLYWLS